MFGMILLIALVFGTTMLVRTGILFPLRASGTDQPKAVQISNVRDNGFTVSYTTDSSVVGSITYGETQSYGTVILDERDAAGNTSQPHSVHTITISNLKPQTKYFFAIISGSTTYTNNNLPYEVTTAATLPAPPGGSTVIGSINKPDGTKPAEAIIYVSTEGSQILSAIAKADGTYAIPISELRDTQFSAYKAIEDQTVLNINVIGDGLLSSVKVNKNKTNPLPSITLSQDYDFTLSGTDSLTPVASSSASEESAGLPKFSTDKPINANPQILTPEKDQTFSDEQPQFTGTAPPNRTVEIVIHSTQEIRATVRTDKFGSWIYRPTKALAPGTHTIQITTKDEAGFTRTILQSFIVNAQGSQFTEPSVEPTKSPTPTKTPPTATPTPTRTPTPTPTKSPTTTVTTKPTISVTPTNIPTQQPTPTFFPTLTPVPTEIVPTQIVLLPTQVVKPSISPPGSNEVVITVSIAALAMIGGAVLFFLTQGGGL